MGSFFAHQLPPGTRCLVHSRTAAKARSLADAVNGGRCTSIADLAPAGLVAVAVPAAEVAAVIDDLLRVVDDGTIVLNMATAARVPDHQRSVRPDVHLVEAKVVGHAGTLALGVPGLVVVDGPDHVFGTVAACLPGFGRVVRGDASLVETVNRIGSKEAARAVVAIRRGLADANVPEGWFEPAIRNVASGTVRAIAEDDIGHFLRSVLDNLERAERSPG